MTSGVAFRVCGLLCVYNIGGCVHSVWFVACFNLRVAFRVCCVGLLNTL